MHRFGVFAQEQHGGGFRGLVGVLPDPGAVGVADMEGRQHRFAQDAGVKALAGLEGAEKAGRGGENAARFRAQGFLGQAQGGGLPGENRGHDGMSPEKEKPAASAGWVGWIGVGRHAASETGAASQASFWKLFR